MNTRLITIENRDCNLVEYIFHGKKTGKKKKKYLICLLQPVWSSRDVAARVLSSQGLCSSSAKKSINEARSSSAGLEKDIWPAEGKEFCVWKLLRFVVDSEIGHTLLHFPELLQCVHVHACGGGRNLSPLHYVHFQHLGKGGEEDGMGKMEVCNAIFCLSLHVNAPVLE